MKSPMTPEYRAWSAMKTRCYNQNCKDFKRYGGRGITVCDVWRRAHGFPAFLAHVGLRPTKDHSIERINNNGNYEPGNVKWATRDEQRANRRRVGVFPTIFIDLNGGRRVSLSQAATELGIKRRTLFRRYQAGEAGVQEARRKAYAKTTELLRKFARSAGLLPQEATL